MEEETKAEPSRKVRVVEVRSWRSEDIAPDEVVIDTGRTADGWIVLIAPRVNVLADVAPTDGPPAPL